MKNPDVSSVAQLADAALKLVQDSSSMSGPDLDAQVEVWNTVLESTIDQIGASTQVQNLKSTFDLSNQEVVFILLVSLPSLDSKYSDFFLQTSGDLSSTPTIELVGSLVSVTFAKKDALLTQLEKNPLIFTWGLLKRVGEDFRTSAVSPGPELVLFLSADSPITASTSGLVSLVSTSPLVLPFDQNVTAPQHQLITITGGFEDRRVNYAYNLSQLLNKPLFNLHPGILENSGDQEKELTSALLLVLLNEGLLFWDGGCEYLTDQPLLANKLALWLQLPGAGIALGETNYTPVPTALQKTQGDVITLKEMTSDMCLTLWKVLGEAYLGVSSINYEVLNTTYYPDYDRMVQAFRRVKESHSDQQVDQSDFTQAYLETSPTSINAIAHLDSTNVNFEDDTVFQTSMQQQLSYAEKAYRNRDLTDPYQPVGIPVLFQGPIGSGKTLAVLCVGNAVGLPVYKVDYPVLLASVKTEQAVKDFFYDAEKNSALLLFEDADSLFQQKNSSDSDLLIQPITEAISSYGGMIIMTTLQKEKLARSIIMNLQFIVNFPAYSAKDQYNLFIQLLGKMGLTIANKQYLEQLVMNLGANGRQIQNIVKNAVLSAKNRQVSLEELAITAQDLANAVKIESNKN